MFFIIQFFVFMKNVITGIPLTHTFIIIKPLCREQLQSSSKQKTNCKGEGGRENPRQTMLKPSDSLNLGAGIISTSFGHLKFPAHYKNKNIIYLQKSLGRPKTLNLIFSYHKS